MKKEEHMEESARIGRASWALQNFDQLPRHASKESQIEALFADKRWQDDHANEIARRIDRLIGQIGQIEDS